MESLVTLLVVSLVVPNLKKKNVLVSIYIFVLNGLSTAAVNYIFLIKTKHGTSNAYSPFYFINP